MLSQWIRVLYSDNGTLTDYSIEAQNNDTFTFSYVKDEDYIYIGQTFPFNSIYCILGSTVNAEASVVGVQYWSYDEWKDAVDVLDSTKITGASLARNGQIIWSPDRDYVWDTVQDTTDSSAPTELSGVEIYDMYWCRIKFSESLTASVIMDKLSYIFCDESILANIDPDINDFLASWESGKTDWLEQRHIASKHVVSRLNRNHIIKQPGQILRNSELYLPTAYRTLAVIYGGLGGDKYIEKKKDAMAEYEALMTGQNLTIDKNNDARTQKSEISKRSGEIVR